MIKSFVQEFQSRGRVLRTMENQIGKVPMTIDVFDRLKKKYDSNTDFVKTDVYGNIIRPYTLH